MTGAVGRVVLQTDPAWSEELLATKTTPPGPERGFASRPRLLTQLDAGLAGGLTVVCAAAGSGKTALLADWARRSGHPVAWLTLDAGDDDPARFWRSVSAALHRTAHPVAGEVVLVLDEYQVIGSPQVHEALGALVEHRPAGLHLVVAGRTDPPLPLARLRARGRLTEVRDADLRCTPAEAGALLRGTVGTGTVLPDDTVQELADRTEGWVAGLKLAALSLRGRADVPGFVSSFSGRHRHVLDFLTEEVLDHQTGPVRRFLLETSVLDRLSGELCDAVTGGHDGQRVLESIEAAHLFLLPLDEVRGWWRYHQLFADLLRARLGQEDPDRVPVLHARAADWCSRHGLVDDAIGHALAAGDTDLAAGLIERHVDERVLRSEGTTVQRWLAALPDDLLRVRPRLLAARALLALVAGRVDDVEAPLAAAERGADLATAPFEPSVGGSRSLVADVRALLAFERGFLAELQGDVDGTVAGCRRALARLGDRRTTLGAVATAHLGVAAWLAGRLGEAERVLSGSVAELRTAGEAFLAVRMSDSLGQVQCARGELDAAAGTYSRARSTAVPRVLPAAGIAAVGLAGIAYQRDELDAALEHLSEGIAACRQLAYSRPLAVGLTLLAWTRQIRGDRDGALAAMDEAARVVPGSGRPGLLDPVPAQRARLLLAQGDAVAAARWTTSSGLHPDDDPEYVREPGHLVLARVLLAQDLPERALALLARLEHAAEAQRRGAGIVEIRALRALALAACGNGPDAVGVLADALRSGARAGFVRVFADEGPPMRALVHRLVARDAAGDVPPDHLGRVLRAFEPGPGAGTSAGPAETLSAREAEVLRLVATGRRNQEIADELVVELSTVKKHVTHILQKLGVETRTGATARARALGLLPQDGGGTAWTQRSRP